jgi:hypothetical protein
MTESQQQALQAAIELRDFAAHFGNLTLGTPVNDVLRDRAKRDSALADRLVTYLRRQWNAQIPPVDNDETPD